jgi:transposase InsO family protein
MPWREVSMSEARREFVRLAQQEGANRRELCRRFGIHPDTGYKWLSRWQAGERDLADRSRRPHGSPWRSSPELEARVVAVRAAHPAWGARKIAHVLRREGLAAPAVSTVHAILTRHGLVMPAQGGPPASRRFEMAAANLLWQMDFKGWIRLGDGRPCHPLTLIDDHSRFCPGLEACLDQREATVRTCLTRIFSRHGLPEALFVDNGPPWGDSRGAPWTKLRVWLTRLGVGLIHARPYHPQSRGKNERFHRSLKAELLDLRRFRDEAELQSALDGWRDLYNHERPHEGLAMQIPAERYRPSPRAMPDILPEPLYDEGEITRRVPLSKDYITFKGRLWKVPSAFRGETLAIRPLDRDGTYGIFFAAHHLATIDLTAPKTVGHLSEQPSVMSQG